MHKLSLRLTLKEAPKGAIKKSPSNHPKHKALATIYQISQKHLATTYQCPDDNSMA